MFPILLPQLLAVATLCGFNVASHTPDAQLKDESSDRIESEFWYEQLSPYVEYDDDDVKSDVGRRPRTRAAAVQYTLSVRARSRPPPFVLFDSFGTDVAPPDLEH